MDLFTTNHIECSLPKGHWCCLSGDCKGISCCYYGGAENPRGMCDGANGNLRLGVSMTTDASNDVCNHEPAADGYIMAWCGKCNQSVWRKETPEEIAFNVEHAKRHRHHNDYDYERGMFEKE